MSLSSVAYYFFQGDSAKMFPFLKQTRPSSLPLPVTQRGKKDDKQNSINQELKQFAGTLVDGVIKTVSETKADNLGMQTTEIMVTDVDKNSETNDKTNDVSVNSSE